MAFTVDKKLLPLKGHYFLFNAGTAPVVPFMPTLAKQLGFSSTIVGTIYTVLPITGMLAKPLFGLMADRFKKQKFFFILFQLVTALSFFGIMFVQSKVQTPSVQLHCNDGESSLKFCPKKGKISQCLRDELAYGTKNIDCQIKCKFKSWMAEVMCDHWQLPEACNEVNDGSFILDISSNRTVVSNDCIFMVFNHAEILQKNVSLYCPFKQTRKYFNATCEAKCSDHELEQMISEDVITEKNAFKMFQFWLFLSLLVLSWIGMAVVVSIGDAICFEMLGDRHHLYGNQRLWGAIGFGICSLIAGFLVDQLSSNSFLKDYTIVFCMTLVLIGLDIIVSTRLQHFQVNVSTNIIADVSSMFLSPNILLFFTWCVVVGVCTALIWNLLFWHLEELATSQDTCGSQSWIKTLQGLVMCIQCFGGEVPLFFLSGYILKKIGHVNAMGLVLFGFSLRFILYSLLTNPWWVLPIELLNGLTFGIFYPTMTSYACVIAPPGTEATLQGLVGAIFEGVGVSMGSFLGGILFDSIGGNATFRVYGIFALCALVFHVCIHRFWPKLKASDTSRYYSTPSDAMHILEE